MAAEKYEYPDTGPVTNSFLPSLDGQTVDSPETFDAGVLTDDSSGAQQYAYKEGIKIKTWRRGYKMMTQTDRNNFEAFVNVVGGEKLKFTDWNAVEHTVTFASFRFEFVPREGVLWDWVITLREEL